MRTADEIAGAYLGGDAARQDLKNAILEYGEAMAHAASGAEREACAKIAESVGSGPYSSTAGWALSERISNAIRARSTLKE